MSQQKKLDSDDIYGDIHIIKKERKYSPNNSNRIVERIIQYFEDPKDAKALAEIKRLSNRAKLRSSKDIPRFMKDLNDPDLALNTETNRIMFKEPKNERAIKLDNSAKKKLVIKIKKRIKHLQEGLSNFLPKLIYQEIKI